MLTSALDQLMTSFGSDNPKIKQDLKKKHQKRHTKDILRDCEKAVVPNEDLEQKSENLVVCGLISTDTGKICVVGPAEEPELKNSLVHKSHDSMGEDATKDKIQQISESKEGNMKNNIIQEGMVKNLETKEVSDLREGFAKNIRAKELSDLKEGMAKLQFLSSRLLTGKLTLATVIAFTRF